MRLLHSSTRKPVEGKYQTSTFIKFLIVLIFVLECIQCIYGLKYKKDIKKGTYLTKLHFEELLKGNY